MGGRRPARPAPHPSTRLAPHPRDDPVATRLQPQNCQERLGHASVSFTMDVYQHVLPGMQAQAASTFGTAIFGEE